MTAKTQRREERRLEFTMKRQEELVTKVISYLKAARKTLGLLVNFHEFLLKNGLKRILYS